jgi:hypothetical protein
MKIPHPVSSESGVHGDTHLLGFGFSSSTLWGRFIGLHKGAWKEKDTKIYVFSADIF